MGVWIMPTVVITKQPFSPQSWLSSFRCHPHSHHQYLQGGPVNSILMIASSTAWSTAQRNGRWFKWNHAGFRGNSGPQLSTYNNHRDMRAHARYLSRHLASLSCTYGQEIDGNEPLIAHQINCLLPLFFSLFPHPNPDSIKRDRAVTSPTQFREILIKPTPSPSSLLSLSSSSLFSYLNKHGRITLGRAPCLMFSSRKQSLMGKNTSLPSTDQPKPRWAPHHR